MSVPFTLDNYQKVIMNFITSTYFGMSNPLPTIVCLPGVIAENPKMYIQLVGTYGSILGAITTLVGIGYTIKYATRLVKKIIKKKKHRTLKSNENNFINDVAKDAKKTKIVTKKNITKFIQKRNGHLSKRQKKIITTVLRTTKIKKSNNFS